jgi:hypothetical protein
MKNTSAVQPTPTKFEQTPSPPVATEARELPSETPSPELAIATPVPACVDLYYGEYAQFEIINPSGRRVLVDVNDPEKLSYPVVDRDILLTTHTHWDHFNEEFQANFPGKQLFVQTGLLGAPDVLIQGIASSHNAGDQLLPEGGTNYIYIIETAGLRIAHFGDIGQTSFSDAQLKDLGKIDIAITQFHNPYSEMNAENRKGIQLMDQLQPSLIIPTHSNLDTIKLAKSLWNGYYAEAPSLQICDLDLTKSETQILLMGDVVETMRKYVELVPWENR